MLSQCSSETLYTSLDSFKHPILAPFSPLGYFFFFFFFWLSNVCTECWKPSCSAASALFIQLPAGCRVAFISGSELTNADTEIIHPVKNSLTRLICGRSPQPFPCRALQQRTGIIYDWHNHKIALRARGVCSPGRKLPDSPGCSIPFSKLDLAALQCPPSPFRERPILKDRGGVGQEIAFIFHPLQPPALLPAQYIMVVGTQSKVP